MWNMVFSAVGTVTDNETGVARASLPHRRF